MPITVDPRVVSLHEEAPARDSDKIEPMKQAEKSADDNTAADQGRFEAFSWTRFSALAGVVPFAATSSA